jgi:hypothetical protein
VIINPATGAVKLGDFGLVRALDGSSGARGFGSGNGSATGNGNGNGNGGFSPQRRGMPRSNSFPRVAMNGDVAAGHAGAAAAAAAPKAPRVGITANVATGGGGGGGVFGAASPLSLPPQPAQPPGGSRLTRRLTPLILGPPPPPAPLRSADDAWPPPAPLLATSPAATQAPRPRLRRQMTPQTGSLVTMAPEVWEAAPEYGTAADIYSLVRVNVCNVFICDATFALTHLDLCPFFFSCFQGRLISYMKTLHWRWRGVASLDAMEAACTRTEPAARPTVRPHYAARRMDLCAAQRSASQRMLTHALRAIALARRRRRLCRRCRLRRAPPRRSAPPRRADGAASRGALHAPRQHASKQRTLTVLCHTHIRTL